MLHEDFIIWYTIVQFVRSNKFKIYIHFMLGLKVMYFNARGWSTRPKHVAYVDETDKALLWSTAVLMSVLI
jgi:hypothetical protein